jgi:serine/threonine protein kinase
VSDERPPRKPTPEELKAIAYNGTVSADVMRWLNDVDDGSVAAEIERLRSHASDPEATVEHPIGDLSDERFLNEFADAHKAGLLGQRSIVEAPEAPGYEIEHEINRGAQGAVFKARQIATRRQVALKVLLRGAFASDRQRIRFEREVEMVAALKHPNIVTIYDSGLTHDGRAWLAMEYVDGEPMDGWIGRHECSGVEPRRRMIASLIATTCDGVVAAHQRGIIHRDLKPDNVLVDSDGVPHILDFGLAKPVDASQWDSSQLNVTNAGEFMGTFAYASPEQVSGDPDRIDVRTDVFALGVMLYEALLGARPYVLEGAIADVVKTISEGVPIAPRSVDASLDQDLETILLRALDRDTERRYQSPADLARDLRHWLAREPIEARRDDAWYVARKTLRKHWLAVTLGTAAVGVLIAFGIIMFVAWDRSTEANRRLTGTVEMVSNVLSSADSENPNQPLAASSVGEMMQRWLTIVDTDLSDYPAIAASVRLDLAEILISAGRWNEAADAIEQAASTLNLDPATPSLEAGRLLHDRGRLHYKRRDMSLAAADYTAALSHRRAIAPESEQTADTMHHLASVLRANGSPKESDDLFEDALVRHRKLLGNAHGEVAAARHRAALGNLLNSIAVGHMVNEPQIALPLLQEARELLEIDSADPTRDWRIASLRHNVGDCLARLHRLDEARMELTQAFAIKKLQGNRLSMANTEAAMARLSLRSEDAAAAHHHLEAAQTLRADRLPAGHPSRRDEAHIEIEILLLNGKLDDAESLLSRQPEALSPASQAVLLRLEGLLTAARGQIDRAIAQLQVAWNTSASTTGEQSPQCRKVAADLVKLFRAKGNIDEANHYLKLSAPPQ